MNHWKCTCAVGRLRPLSSNWLWIIQLVSEISGNSCMFLIDMLLVFPFLFSKNLQTLFFFGMVWLLSVHADEDVRQCEKADVGGRWGIRQRSWARRIHNWSSNLTCTGTKDLCQPGAAGCQKWRDQRVWYFQTRPGSAEDTGGVKGRVGERRVEEHWAATARRERPAVTQYTLLLVPVCKWTRPTVTAGPHINQPLAVRQQVGLVCLDTEPTAQLQSA